MNILWHTHTILSSELDLSYYVVGAYVCVCTHAHTHTHTHTHARTHARTHTLYFSEWYIYSSAKHKWENNCLQNNTPVQWAAQQKASTLSNPPSKISCSCNRQLTFWTFYRTRAIMTIWTDNIGQNRTCSPLRNTSQVTSDHLWRKRPAQ